MSENITDKKIRFIDSHYKDLFEIPNGGYIQLEQTSGEVVSKKCGFIDEYHTLVGTNVFHICEFAEHMESNGTKYFPEPEIAEEQAAWKVGRSHYLAIQTCDDGYDFTLYDDKLAEFDGGQLDNPEMSMLEIRNEILEDFKLEKRDLVETDYDELMDKAIELEIENVRKQSLDTNLNDLAGKLDRFAENFDHYEYQDAVEDTASNIESIKNDLKAGNVEAYQSYLKEMIVESREETSVEVAKVLLKDLDKIAPEKRPSVMDKLKPTAEKEIASKSHKHKEPER